MRRLLGILARHHLAPRQGRYMIVVQTGSNYYNVRIDWATPDVAGAWFTDLLESGILDPPPGTQWRNTLEVYPLQAP